MIIIDENDGCKAIVFYLERSIVSFRETVPAVRANLCSRLASSA